MKRFYTIVVFVLISQFIWACSCFPYEPNFYKNIHKSNFVCLVVFDSVEVVITDTLNDRKAYYGHAKVIKSYGENQAAMPGELIRIKGQDGLNCLESIFFNHNDTLLMSLDFDAQGSFELQGLCGLHYLKLTNGCVRGLCFDDIEKKIKGILSYQDPRCYCFPPFSAFNFLTNIHKSNTHVLAKFHRFDYNYQHNGFKSQTGYFTLLDSIGKYGPHFQDTIVVIGEDGLNCGEQFHWFNNGDTTFLALSTGYHRPFVNDTFYLQGWPCGRFFAKVKNGKIEGKTITQVKEIVLTKLTTSTENIEPSLALDIFPNPTSQSLYIRTKDHRILNIECTDITGQKVNIDWDSNSEIDVSHLPSGQYFLKIITENHQIVRKIVKL